MLHLAVFLALQASRPAADATVPRAGELNPYIVEVLKTYPTDGKHRYFWPKKGGWAGNTRDLRYRGELFSKGDPKGRAYCCGLTFEVFFRAWQAWCRAKRQPFVIGTFDTTEKLRSFRREWFGADGNRRCAAHALVDNDLGIAVDKLADARAGDFVQLWRHSGSGHSVVFDSWVKEKAKIVGMRYWSTQKSTRGIGYRVERFGGKKGIKKDECWIARVGRGNAERSKLR